MLNKYYSLDECYKKESVYNNLDELQDEGLIYYEIVDTDIIKIKDIGLSEKQINDLLTFFDEMDVIDYQDFDDNDDYDDYQDDDYDGFRPSDDYF